jgi:TetR/AcrR family transcriptional repressor of nem operon
MRLTKANKQKITERIRSGAAKTFRDKGYDAVSLDMLMKEAGLTRGAFYAHYPSKGALFADVLRAEHPLLAMLRARQGTHGDELHRQMLELFDAYLDPAHHEAVFAGCTLAALAGDATRADDAGKTAFGAAITDFCEEMARGQGQAHERYIAPLLIASGAVRTVAAISDTNQRAMILTSARTAFQAVLPAPSTEEV